MGNQHRELSDNVEKLKNGPGPYPIFVKDYVTSMSHIRDIQTQNPPGNRGSRAVVKAYFTDVSTDVGWLKT